MRFDTPLAKIIAEQIRDGGAISFRDFMELALYHPEQGYYNRPQASIGKSADFYTSPHVSPIFGWTIGRAIERFFLAVTADERKGAKRKGPPAPLVIVEFGAGRGFLAKDVLEYFLHQNSSLFKQLQFVIVEQSPALRRQQRKLFELAPGLQDHVQWCAVEELEPFGGFVLANEFLDALPFHRLMFTRDGFREVFVGFSDEGFREVPGPIEDARLQTLVRETFLEPKNTGFSWTVGQQIEISIDAVDWIASLPRILTEGRVLIMDYGEEVEKLFNASRLHGTTRSFFQQHLTEQLYEHIGEQDLTADVNFTGLMQAAEDHGFGETKLQTQAEFLEENEIFKVVEDRERALALEPLEAQRARRQILNLILPEMMGTRFKTMILTRRR